MVECDVDFKIPHYYSIKKIVLDPGRRPRFREKDIKNAQKMIETEFKNYEDNFKNLKQSECFKYIEERIKKVLDKYAPLNGNEIKKQKIYRIKMPKEQMRANKKRKTNLNKVRKRTKELHRDPNNEYKNNSYR